MLLEKVIEKIPTFIGAVCSAYSCCESCPLKEFNVNCDTRDGVKQLKNDLKEELESLKNKGE